MLQDLELQSNSVVKNTENNQLLQNTSVSTPKIQHRNFGKCFVFCFFKGEPIFTIGPHCKKIAAFCSLY